MPSPESLEELIYDHHKKDEKIITPLAEQLSANGNEEFHRVVPKTLGMVPIQIAQEPPEFIERTLHEYIKQVKEPTTQPLSLVLSANYPKTDNPEYEARARENIQLIKAFKESSAGKQLPLSYFEKPYPAETSIGEIRRHLAGAALHYVSHQYERQPIPESTNAFISDIDVWRFSRQCLARLQQRMDEGYSWAAANKRYLPNSDKFPQLNRALRTLNLAHNYSPSSSYDCHAVYTLRALLMGGSFSVDDKVRETHVMRERAQQAMGKAFVQSMPYQVPGAIAVSYPRRPNERLRQGKLSFEFWENNNFGMQDSCREQPTSHQKDISEEIANRFIGEELGIMRGYSLTKFVEMLQEENGDIEYSVLRRIANSHLGRTLRIANASLDLQLEKISIFDGIE